MEFASSGEVERGEQFVFFASPDYGVATNDANAGTGRFSQAVLEELKGQSLLPDMKAIAEQIQSDFLEKQQIQPAYWLKVGNNQVEVNAGKSKKSAQEVDLTHSISDIPLEDICQALAVAFPSKKELEKMFRYGMNKQLDLEVSTIGSVKDIVFDLVNWAEANECVLELIQAAYKANPRKTELRNIAKLLGIPNA